MADLEVPLAQAEDLARQARNRIEESISRLGGDSAVFWYAVALIYDRGIRNSDLASSGMAFTRGDCSPARPMAGSTV